MEHDTGSPLINNTSSNFYHIRYVPSGPYLPILILIVGLLTASFRAGTIPPTHDSIRSDFTLLNMVLLRIDTVPIIICQTLKNDTRNGKVTGMVKSNSNGVKSMNYKSYVINKTDKCASDVQKTDYPGYVITYNIAMELEADTAIRCKTRKLNSCIYSMSDPFKSKCNRGVTLSVNFINTKRY